MKQASWPAFRQVCNTPQRVCWAVARHEEKVSICPLGWHMNTSIHPPMMAVSIAPPRYTHDLIADSGECVLAWPGAELAEATMVAGTQSGRVIDKFVECGLTGKPSNHVAAPLIEECIANLECKVRGMLTTGDHTVFALEVVETWLAEAPGQVLCQIGPESGYDFLLEKGAYRFGVVRR